MSRLHQFKHSLISGYVALIGNILYTFLSVPLALHYLSRPEFGLWALTMQISGYIFLIDMGMSGSVSRLLIDHKDNKAGGAYGGIIKTGALVGMLQGIIVIALGCALAFPLGSLLKVPTELRRELFWLICGQGAILGFSFATRIFHHVLVAHQRYDIANYGQFVAYALSLLVMWAGFAGGLGVYSFLLAQALTATLQTLFPIFGAIQLKLLPAQGSWGTATWLEFKKLFSYGGELFISTIGMQFINASQTILLTRFMGLDTAAVWSIGTRCYGMLASVIWRIQEYSGPPLAEMFVRGERERMRDRLRDLAFLTTNLSIISAAALALCNQTFVELWTRGRIQWLPINDLLLAIWLIALTTMRAHVSLAGAIKRFGFLAYIFVIEGVCFLTLNILLRRVDGITRMLVISILCTMMLTLPYVLWRTRRYFDLAWLDLARWYATSWRMAWRVAIVCAVVYWATLGWPMAWRFGFNAAICAVWGTYALVRYGMGPSLQNDIAAKLPLPMRRIFLGMSGA